MRKFLIIIAFFIFYLPKHILAQNRYAVIIGINEYYDAPGIKSSRHNLKGCVNDALSMKSLLLNRFSFKKENITTLLNAAATEKNMTAAMLEILDKGNPGDAVVFFFCGHGVYIDNPATLKNPFKMGYSQAICMSNLYAPNHGCLVKDNTLKILFNRFVEKKIILTTLFDCCYSGNIAMGKAAPSLHNGYRYNEIEGNKDIPRGSIPFDMSTTLTIADTANIPRPSETKNSRFASLSACTNAEKALEIYDESGRPHGAFTKSLISVFEKSKVDLSFSEVITRITNEVDVKQRLQQDPTYHYDSLRKNTNFIGLPLQKITPPFTARCININNSTITLDAGFNDELAMGNIFKSKNNKISVTLLKVFADSAIATINPALKIKKGDVFVRADPYRISGPLLKVYIPTSNLNSTAFTALFHKEILPFTKVKGYQDYFNWTVDMTSSTFLYTNQLKPGSEISAMTKRGRFYILLSIPKDLASAITAKLKKEQSIQLVHSPLEANLVLYLNYAVVSADNKRPRFVFTYHEPLPPDISSGAINRIRFFGYRATTPNLLLNNLAITALANNIQQITYDAVRGMGTRWINMYARRN
ncbi:caspase family protein [Pedobacter sp. GSP4]|uniref:caspase family protein n=1 Tax=Pedobacter sp. GSP4 TaxID=3453716 RepID=UPI003EEACE1A